MEKRKKRNFDAQFKANAVKQVVEAGKSPAQVARDLDVVPLVLASWVKAARAEPGAPGEGALKHAEREKLTRLRKEQRTWEMERAFPRRAAAFLCQGERVKFAFMAVAKAHVPVRFMCRHLAVSAPGFLASQKRPGTAHAKQDLVLGGLVAEAHLGGRGAYGSPRVHALLKRGGQRVSRKRVARLWFQPTTAVLKRRLAFHDGDVAAVRAQATCALRHSNNTHPDRLCALTKHAIWGVPASSPEETFHVAGAGRLVGQGRPWDTFMDASR